MKDRLISCFLVAFVSGLLVRENLFRRFCAGFVLGKNVNKKRKSSEEEENCWEAKSRFKSITYWKHDSLPSQHDAFLRSFHWFAVAKAVSFPQLLFFFKTR